MLVNACKKIIATRVKFAPSPWPSLPKHPLAETNAQILPAFLGELGFEVKGFLGQIEPWLRTGWKIPARRVALYPQGTAFDDPEFFERIDNISAFYGMRKVGATLASPDTPVVPLTKVGGDADTLELGIRLERKRFDTELTVGRELRKAWFDRYHTPTSRPTRWHDYLTGCYSYDDDINYISMMGVLPSYKPTAYTTPNIAIFEHIGVQLRQMSVETFRNSDIDKMTMVVEKLSDLLQLPVLIYGLPSDATITNYQRTLDVIPNGMAPFTAELSYLSQCRIMLSPDSGWADLMGWLRVPTLLESQNYAFGFENLRPFNPKIALLPPMENLQKVVEQLLNLDEMDCLLPDPLSATDKNINNSPNSLESSQQYWRSFYQ